jgi:putative copper resistance protein D
VIGVALDSPIAAHDDVPSIHVLQHGLLMMLGPLLLALGAPITLAMRSLSRDGRRRLRAVLHDPSVRGLLARPVVLVVDYNAAMALMLVAPVYRLAEHSLVVHIAAHLYLVVCGLLFWTAMLARDPVPGRLPEPSRVRAVAVGVPLNLALAATVALAPWLFIGEPSAAAAQMLVAVTAVTGVLGVVLVPRRRLNAAVVQWLA